MSNRIKQLGSNKTLLLLDDIEVLYSYSTPVAARLEDGSFIRSKNYYKGSTSSTTQKHITQTLNYWSLEYGLKPDQLGSGAELVDQSEIENLIPCFIK
tara:strand:+ start:905 stop:1198 length:294 start_codon:yes stop_codon:yes gene_type:complete